MGRSAKRSAPTAASQRPAKKRKSAEASLAKMREIAEAKDEFSEDEKMEVKPLVSKANAADNAAESEDEDVDVEGLEDHEVVAEESLPVVAPGFRLWETKSKLASKGELTQTSKYDETKDEYTHILKIRHDEAFKLMPLLVTQGPYKGSHVFMLQPQTGFFRFMELPPEIRTMVYGCLFEADFEIRVITRKRVNQPRRPVPINSNVKRGRPRGSPPVEKSLPEGLNLLRASKQILREAAPVLYGNNDFRFDDFADMKIFLDNIGSMRPFLCHLFVDSNGYWRSKARATLYLLKDAIELRTLSLHHRDVCAREQAMWYVYYSTTPERLASMLSTPLRALKKSHEESGSSIDVTDIVKIEWTRCSKCLELESGFAADADCIGPSPFASSDCKVKCKDHEAHCREIEKKVRKAVTVYM